MRHRQRLDRARLMGSAAFVALALVAGGAQAQDRITIAPQPLDTALNELGAQTGQQVLIRSDVTLGKMTRGVTDSPSFEVALNSMLAGTGLTYRREGETWLITKATADPQGGSAASGGAEVEGLIVTAQKREEDIQDVPIAMSAFSQEALERSQIAGGPDLITQIPNMSFTKTNFTSYSIQIRGIGTQAISATTDPAVAVAFNNTPFIRNRFFEQEFYDLQRVEVLRGPQGTLYGRNATAGVVNIISAKPKFSFEAKASADLGNYSSNRIEGMVNIPLVEDLVALRLAGAWTQRDGYATNEFTGKSIDGRDLWSTRLSLRFEPTDWISANLLWEHFQEDDDRLRSGKQLCKRDPSPLSINGIPVTQGGDVQNQASYLSQGCERVSLYSPEAFQTPNGFSLPFYGPTGGLGNPIFSNIDPYLHSSQSRDLRVIESTVEPDYKAKSDIAELQVAIDLMDGLTLNSETSYGADFSWSLQDYNRFTTTPHAFRPSSTDPLSSDKPGLVDAAGFFCDPQLGCSDRLLLVDLSTSKSTQFSQEFRVGSDFDGPFNFSFGANYLRHDAEDKYYVFINSITLLAGSSQVAVPDPYPYEVGVQDNGYCQYKSSGQSGSGATPASPGLVGDTAPFHDPALGYNLTFDPCIYIDPNPIGSLNDQGRNYFLSKNPYKLISYAAFGEIYYNVTPDLKLTGGLRFTVDRKTAPQIPSWLLTPAVTGEYPTAQTVVQEWREPTGRLAVDWKPDLGFTDETLVYASYAHGYKAGGANPPPPVLVSWDTSENEQRELIPDIFGPEFIDAFEVGSKNTLLDGALTLNLTGFYYDYKGYQVSEIRNRSAVNSNYDAEVWGAEIEADWRPIEALKLGFKGGYENTRIADGQGAIDLMDRTAGHDDWVVLRPFPTIPSNCVMPLYVVTAGGIIHAGSAGSTYSACVQAYYEGHDPITRLDYVPNPTLQANTQPHSPNVPLGPNYANYPGFDPDAHPEINGGRGFAKDIGGNELPNAPNYTATVTADYSLPLRSDWMLTLHSDLHWQSESWWRVFNDHEYDRLDAYFTMNAAAIFTNEDAGWKVMAYVKNVTDETALTGAFLNSDDTGLTTNVFLTEPRLYGLRVTKDFTGGGWLGSLGRSEGPYPITVEVGGGVGRASGETQAYTPDWLELYSPTFPLSQAFQDEDFDWGDTRSVKLTYAPSKNWNVSAAYRFGKTKDFAKAAFYEHVPGGLQEIFSFYNGIYVRYDPSPDNHFRAAARDSEEHAITDFLVGKDFGFGALGGGKSFLSLGVRHADLRSTSRVTMDGIPHRVVAPFLSAFGNEVWTMESYTTTLDSDRRFEGWGPSLTWDGALPLLGDMERGHVDIDWSIGAGALFGKQTMDSNEERLANYFSSHQFTFGPEPTLNLYDDPVARSRTEDVTVPNVSLSLGLSYAIDRVKVSTGYTYDRFFDAIDGGFDEAQTYDRTIHGPYLKLSLGFGG